MCEKLTDKVVKAKGPVSSWYLCDPTKNTECNKRICYGGVYEITDGKYMITCSGTCYCTSNREYAVQSENGKALEVLIWRCRKGFASEVREAFEPKEE